MKRKAGRQIIDPDDKRLKKRRKRYQKNKDKILKQNRENRIRNHPETKIIKFFNYVGREEKKVIKKRNKKPPMTPEQKKAARQLSYDKYNETHIEENRKRPLIWYHDHKETPEYKIKQVGYYEVNNAQRRERRDGMSEEERTEFNHNNYIKFKDSFAISHEKNRIERLSVKGEYTVPEWKAIKKICNYKCMNLNCYRDLPDGTEHKDHMIPLMPKNSWCGKGTNFIDNLQPLCPKCNIRKSNKYDVPNLIEIAKNQETNQSNKFYN